MDQRENRASASFEVQAIDDATVEVAGYAAVFNQETVIGGRWREQIAPGAFRGAIFGFMRLEMRPPTVWC